MSEDSKSFSEAVDGFREMHSYLKSFQGFKFIYIRRNANFVAHLCVKEALKLDVLAISFLVTPTYLIETIQSQLFLPAMPWHLLHLGAAVTTQPPFAGRC